MAAIGVSGSWNATVPNAKGLFTPSPASPTFALSSVYPSSGAAW